MEKESKNSKDGKHVFTEEEEGHVVLQQLDDAEEFAKTFEEPDDQKWRKGKSPNEFKQPEQPEEVKDVVHQDFSVPQGDNPPKGPVWDNIITVRSVTVWATAQVAVVCSSGGCITVFPFSTPGRSRPPSAGHCSSLLLLVVCVCYPREVSSRDRFERGTTAALLSCCCATLDSAADNNMS